jgi:glycosyltransferase involved in cell wall biosynthesis
MSHFTSDLFPKILICIPTLNKEEIIGPVLNNILSQSYPTEKMRILIVDGGSNDNTLGIVREILSNSNVDYKIIQRRSNIPEARNICIESMRDDEKALIFWDADILTNNNDLLRVMMKTSLENPKMRVCCGETQEGQILECPKYKLKMNGHKAASINIRRRYLEGKRRARMRGFSTAMNQRKL